VTVITCAATECIHNDGGICAADEVNFTFVGGSHVDMICESFEPRGPGNPKAWRGDTDALDNRKVERSESVGSSHQRGEVAAGPGEIDPRSGKPAAHPGERRDR